MVMGDITNLTIFPKFILTWMECTTAPTILFRYDDTNNKKKIDGNNFTLNVHVWKLLRLDFLPKDEKYYECWNHAIARKMVKHVIQNKKCKI